MRGGAQAHLIEADDGYAYVVKFRNNPQHHRILANEFLTSVFLRYLRISTPQIAIVQLSEDFLRANPEIAIQQGPRRLDVTPGWHFGSRYPGAPEKLPVYDFVPDALLGEVVNLAEFLGMLVFDKWVANADGRQAIFFRAGVRRPSPAGREECRRGMVALMIDEGFAFDGPNWSFPDSPLQGLYHRPLVYRQVESLDSFQPWLDRIVHFPVEVVDEARRQIPPQWIEGEERQLETLLEVLLRRRRRVPDLLRDCRSARPALFPNWREGAVK